MDGQTQRETGRDRKTKRHRESSRQRRREMEGKMVA